MHGGLSIFTGGIVWTFAFTMLVGFGTSAQTLIVCRAMQGLGAAAHLPAGLAMLGKLYSPGARKNLVSSIYGAMAPLGSFVGILVATLTLHYTHWSWVFWIGAGMALVAATSAYFTRPWGSFDSGDDDLCMDWIGCIGLSASLILLIFTLTQAADATQGWRTPYIIVTGIFALAGLALTIRVEGWIATQPLVPMSIFRIQYIIPLLLGLLLTYGAVTLFVCYVTL